MSSLDQLLQMFDEAWSHKDESVKTALNDVTPEAALWQHPAYSATDQMPGMPPAGSILWQVAHLEHSARHYAEILRLRPVTNEPMTSPPKISALAELLALMQQAHAKLRGQIAQLSESDLTRPCARDMTVEEFVRMVIRHDTWHASQIAVGRRLFQESNRIRRKRNKSGS
jgi:uncharacterized damage-inducible protein DinB